MTNSTWVPSLGPEFDAFLYASIGEDRKGMLLSVLSAFARLDLDPWQEAAGLVRLPREAAIQRLIMLIRALPDTPSMHLDIPSIAARLILLLPRQVRANIASHKIPSDTDITINARPTVYVFVILTALLLSWLALGARHVAANRPPPPQADNVAAPAIGTDVPQMPPARSGR
jgi:hypothetical protein